jgi:putative Mg2+ transporter-C (MgtC) family protein
VQHLDQHIYDLVEGFGWPLNAVVRLVLAAVAGGLVGVEREVRGRQAGFRTNLLVCLGSAVAMIVSNRLAFMHWPHGPEHAVTVDPARIAYGVMAGIGFLGAGAILKSDGNVRGLTTAAGLWCVAAIGLAAGLGLYLFVLIASALVLGVLWALGYIERALPRIHYRVVTLRRAWTPGCVTDTVKLICGLGYAVTDWTFERPHDGRSVDIHLRIAFYRRHEYPELEGRLVGKDAGCDLIAVKEVP